MFGRRSVRDGVDYEQYVAREMKKQGFHRIEFTPCTGDFGVDLLARRNGYRYAVQCKFYSGSVGGGAVQEAVAGMAYYDCERALVVTSSRLTPAAAKLAEVNQVEVWENVDPTGSGFLERRKPWQIVFFAVQCVAFGVLICRFQEAGLLTEAMAVRLALFCFPLPFAAVCLMRMLWGICRWICAPRSEKLAEKSEELPLAE